MSLPKLTLADPKFPNSDGFWWARMVMTCGDRPPVTGEWEPRRVKKYLDDNFYSIDRDSAHLVDQSLVQSIWWFEWGDKLIPPPIVKQAQPSVTCKHCNREINAAGCGCDY